MNRKTFVLCIMCLFSAASVFAIDTAGSVVTDFAVYPESKPVLIKDGSGFAPVTGPYNALQLRVTGMYGIVIPVPLGGSPLTQNNTLSFSGGLELTPISFVPIFKITFSPIAFLVFNAGVKSGPGWEVFGIKGLALYNPDTGAYENLAPFSVFHTEIWFEGIFQFDFAALFPGKWHHAVLLGTYKIYYETIGSAGADGRPWIWQSEADYTNGLKYYATAFAGYQMPFVLQMAGVQFEFWGSYNASDYNSRYAAWNPAFMTVTVSPVLNFRFSEKHNLSVQFRFKSRRGFDTDAGFPLDRTYTGREWFFDRVGFSYSYTF